MGLFNPSTGMASEDALPMAAPFQGTGICTPRSDSGTLVGLGDVNTILTGTSVTVFAPTATRQGGLTGTSLAVAGTSNAGWQLATKPFCSARSRQVWDLATEFLSATNQRIFCGLEDATPNGFFELDDNLGSYALFRFSTVVPDTNWRCMTRTNTAGAITNLDSGVAFAANTLYLLRIIMTPTAVKFYINGVLVATSTTDIPVSTATMFSVFGLQTQEAAGKSIRFYGTSAQSSWT